jgi:hypothetical protein
MSFRSGLADNLTNLTKGLDEVSNKANKILFENRFSEL